MALEKISTSYWFVLLWGPLGQVSPGVYVCCSTHTNSPGRHSSPLCSHLSQHRPTLSCWSGASWQRGFPQRLGEAKQRRNIDGSVAFHSRFTPGTQIDDEVLSGCLDRLEIVFSPFILTHIDPTYIATSGGRTTQILYLRKCTSDTPVYKYFIASCVLCSDF